MSKQLDNSKNTDALLQTYYKGQKVKNNLLNGAIGEVLFVSKKQLRIKHEFLKVTYSDIKLPEFLHDIVPAI